MSIHIFKTADFIPGSFNHAFQSLPAGQRSVTVPLPTADKINKDEISGYLTQVSALAIEDQEGTALLALQSLFNAMEDLADLPQCDNEIKRYFMYGVVHLNGALPANTLARLIVTSPLYSMTFSSGQRWYDWPLLSRFLKQHALMEAFFYQGYTNPVVIDGDNAADQAIKQSVNNDGYLLFHYERTGLLPLNTLSVEHFYWASDLSKYPHPDNPAIYVRDYMSAYMSSGRPFDGVEFFLEAHLSSLSPLAFVEAYNKGTLCINNVDLKTGLNAFLMHLAGLSEAPENNNFATAMYNALDRDASLREGVPVLLSDEHINDTIAHLHASALFSTFNYDEASDDLDTVLMSIIEGVDESINEDLASVDLTTGPEEQ